MGRVLPEHSPPERLPKVRGRLPHRLGDEPAHEPLPVGKLTDPPTTSCTEMILMQWGELGDPWLFYLYVKGSTRTFSPRSTF